MVSPYRFPHVVVVIVPHDFISQCTHNMHVRNWLYC